MKKKDEKVVTDEIINEIMNQKESSEVKQYETTTLSDYKFVIVLLSVIIVFTFLTPFIFKGLKNLEDSNFIENLFSKKENTVDTPVVDNKDDDVVKVVNGDKSGANAPVLETGMIPVRYNYIEKKWVKANKDNVSTNLWYNYNNKEWANAILVRENGTKTREFYENATADTVINDEDILAFFVWIPRYKYSIISNMGLQQIDVSFEGKDVTKTTGPNYVTHPAFTFNGEELAGIWVGKFEITGNMSNLTVLPYQTAITNQNIKTIFDGIQFMYGNAYGLNNDNTTIKLMKNTEWGAVTYLTNSKYGICSKEKCKKIAAYSYDYSSETGVLASTTGNVTGVYAMNGGVMEYVMGNNNSVPGLSGFDNVWMSENKKYFDIYSDGTSTDFTRGINGDATKEFGPFTELKSSWNSAYASFVDSANPWFFRDIENNIYSFSKFTGAAHSQVGFRISLS